MNLSSVTIVLDHSVWTLNDLSLSLSGHARLLIVMSSHASFGHQGKSRLSQEEHRRNGARLAHAQNGAMIRYRAQSLSLVFPL